MANGNTDNGAATAATATTAIAPKKQPSLYARKLLQKLSTLHPNASLESRQTIASWMVFNRKKCEGMGEGLLLSMENAVATGEGSSNDSSSATAAATTARLMLLLKILHQVQLSNCPTVSSAATAGVEGDVDKWTKSSQLRTRLGEIVILPLWKALASSLSNMSSTNGGDTNNIDDNNDRMGDEYRSEVRGMLEEWKEHNVFGGPTVWEEYKRGWGWALKESVVADGGGESESDAKGESGVEVASVGADENVTATITEPLVDDVNKKSLVEEKQSTVSEESNRNDETGNANVTSVAGDLEDKKQDEKGGSDIAMVDIPTTLIFEESGESKAAARAPKRDSVASATVEVEVDFEGVEEARVEPSRFLDACKNIATIQITRDLGSDAAMNLSSALANIPTEVEEACNTILTQQQNGNDDEKITPIADLLPADSLANLPDELLDLDLKYARQSLQTYREAIRQQRKARLQCLQLLLRSRCSFGSKDAARAFCGGEGSDVNMEVVLEKLKKRKEILVDAMALEGLDVEEDEEEKKMEKDDESLKPLSWFTEAESGKVEEPEAKKLKSS